MCNSTKVLVTVFAFALSAAVTPATAQGLEKVDRAAIVRSYKLQAELARVEQNRPAVISQFIANWDAVVDHTLIDVSAQLRPLLEKATPLQLYAASLVGDWVGMVQVLRGESSAVKVVNTLDSPQAPAGITAAAPIGQSTNSLVFTPIAPCRIADTRGSGARTGLLGTFISRTFDLTTGGFGKGQGGSLSCPGLPSFNHAAWSVNFTLTGYSSDGYLNVWPFGGAIPASSMANFGPAQVAIANSGTATGCYGCIDSITLRASVPTHIILDVYGYFERAAGFAGINKLVVAGTTTSVGPGEFKAVIGGDCPAGTIIIGGIQSNSSFSGTILTGDHLFFPVSTSWAEFVKNNGGTSENVTVSSTCYEVQVSTP